MPRRFAFDAVRAIGRTLTDVEETTTWGGPTLKVRGKMFVCMATPLAAEAPETYCLKGASSAGIIRLS